MQSLNISAFCYSVPLFDLYWDQRALPLLCTHTTKWLDVEYFPSSVFLLLPLSRHLSHLSLERAKKLSCSEIFPKHSGQLLRSTICFIYLQYFDSAAQCVSKKWSGGELACLVLNSQQSTSCCDMTWRWLADDGRQKNSHCDERRRDEDRVEGVGLFQLQHCLSNNEERERK